MKVDIIVAGGGASGMTAAIMAARQGKKVMILEHKDRIGKKLLATGNGKCNYTNENQQESCYRSSNSSYPMQVLRQYGMQETMEFFYDLGIYPKVKNGYVYPNSGQAASVLDVLRLELSRYQVPVCCRERVMEIVRDTKGFRVVTDKTVHRAGRVILCTGGMASSKLGSDGSGYALAEALGHHIIPAVPALTGLKARGDYYKALAGVRAEAGVSLWIDDCFTAKDTGEVQLAAYGISGIPVFQISRYAAAALLQKRKVTVYLDFMPSLPKESLNKIINERSVRNKSAEEMMIGLLPGKLSLVLLKRAGISLAESLFQKDREQRKLSDMIKHFSTDIYDTNGFDNAQATAGGVDTREVDCHTMESVLVPGLYLAGELLDVDGICGGYNLQWAWSTGAIAGIHASQTDKE